MWRRIELGFGIGPGRHINPYFVGRLLVKQKVKRSF
jgi:hypothetical protein